MKSTNLAVLGGALAAALYTSPVAAATTVTFESAPTNILPGGVTEGDISYSKVSGNLYVNTYGNPGHDLEGSVFSGGGTVEFVSATSSTFTFSGLDYDAYSDAGIGAQTLVVQGFLNGALQGSDSFSRGNSSGVTWTSFAAVNLLGVNIDALSIRLNASVADASTQAIDNVRFNAAAPAVPEPNTWAMMFLGFGIFGAAMRRRQTMKAAVRVA